jgi:hypothetical protein
MNRIGFDNDKYLKLQSQKIRDRISEFGGKLYLEFGGKLFDDYHASRVLPGFEPDSKVRMLLEMKDVAEIVIALSADDIERSKRRGDLGITYEDDTLRLIDAFRGIGLFIGSVVITHYRGQPIADQFIKRLGALGIKTYKNLFIEAGAGIQVNGGTGASFIDDAAQTDPTSISFIDDLLNTSTVMVRLNVPVNLTYRFEFAKIFAVAPYAGLNFGFNLYAYSGESLFSRSGDVITDSFGMQYTYNPKRFQMGWQAGVNFSVIGITVGVGYQGNFSSFDSREYLPQFQQDAINTYGTDTPKISMGGLVVSLGWGF